MLDRKKIYLIIPTYNEAENIELLIKQIFALKIDQLKVMVIDDNSPDGTASIVERLTNKYQVKVIKRSGKMGIGSAYILGFKNALAEGADLIFQMDADFSHQPKIIPDFIKAIDNGADAVIGSRYIPGGEIINWSWLRKFMSSSAIWLSRAILKLKTKDITGGFRCFKYQVLGKINLDKINSNGYAFQEEMLYRCEQAGFKIVEVPIKFVDRSRGRSKLSFIEIIKFFITLVRLKINANKMRINR
jgi:dolichol-phosphate mannosyltransferase